MSVRVRSGEQVVVTGDEACLDHKIQPGTLASIVCQGYRPDVWLVQVGGERPLVSVHEDDMISPDQVFKPGFPVPVKLDVTVTREVSQTGGAKDSKLARFDQIPSYPLRLLAERYGAGNQKYETGPGELDNWRKGYAWSLSYAAMQRHANAFWSGEDIDPDSGQPHLAAVAWHAFTLLEWGRHPELAEKYDDRQDPRSINQ